MYEGSNLLNVKLVRTFAIPYLCAAKNDKLI